MRSVNVGARGPGGRRRMRWTPCTGLALVVGCLGWLTLAAGSVATASPVAAAAAAPSCPSYTGSGIPAGSGIPPWGFHATQTFPGGRSGYAHGWGNIDLGAGTVNGYICQFVAGQAVKVTLGPRIIAHSHVAQMWGYPGNLVKAPVKVAASTDPRCKVGTTGTVVMYASYNGVRSDSIQFFLGHGCRDQSHLYHGPQVDAQVPPL